MRASESAHELVQRYADWIVAEQPVEATRMGDHTRDGEWPELTDRSLDGWTRGLSGLWRSVQAAIDGLPANPTDDDLAARGDLVQLRDAIEARTFELEQRRRLHRDPLAVVSLVADGLDELQRRAQLAAQRGADVDPWVRALGTRLRGVPHLIEQGARLLEGSPAPHRTVALGQMEGLQRLVGKDLVVAVAELGAPIEAVEEASRPAAEAVAAYAAFLHELGDVEPLPWRLGPEQHATALRTALGSRMPADEVRRRAEDAFAARRAALAEQAGRWWRQLDLPGSPPDDPDERSRAALAAVGRDTSPRDALVVEARRAVDEAAAWCEASGVVDVPDATHLRIAEVPAHQQGLFVAYLEPAPTLEPDAGSTYFLSPVPDDWSDDRAASFLREYNRSALQALAVHEAYPGHFLQLERASRHPRLARRLLGSSAFAEGWAVYTESMVQEVASAHADDPVLGVYAAPRFRLVELKMQLRVAANALLDTGLHAGELDDAGAFRLLTEGAFQEDEEARGKLVRAKVTSGQLSSYFVGGEEVADLRADVEAAWGAGFDLRRFHDAATAHGSPPVAVLRDEMLGVPTA